MSQTLVIFESKYGLSETIARDIGRILGPSRVCRAGELGSIAGTAPGKEAPGRSPCASAASHAEFIVIVTPVYRHRPDDRIIEFVEANSDWLCARRIALVCVGLATSPGAVRSYLEPLAGVLGECVVWTGGLGGRVAMDWLDAADRIDIERAQDMRGHRGLSEMDAYSAEAVAEAALAIKAIRDSYSRAAPPDEVRRRIDGFLRAHNTCTLCTGAGGHVRATPVEYVYRDGALYLLSEGGEKFAHLMVNANVSVAVYDPYRGMDSLAGLQLEGHVELVPEGTEEYTGALGWQGVEPDDVAAMPYSLNLLRVHLERGDLLWAGFERQGFSRHQAYQFPYVVTAPPPPAGGDAPAPPGEPRA